MGNKCLKISNTTESTQNDHQELYEMAVHREVEAIRRMGEPRSEKKKIMKKVVEREEQLGHGVVRIKVVMRQEELKKILSCSGKDDHAGQLKYSSVEKILESAMKLRMSQVGTSVGGSTSNWRPALESIPEEH